MSNCSIYKKVSDVLDIYCSDFEQQMKSSLYSDVTYDVIKEIIKYNSKTGVFVYRDKIIVGEPDIRYFCLATKCAGQLGMYSGSVPMRSELIETMRKLGCDVFTSSIDIKTVKYKIYTSVREECCRIIGVDPDDSRSSLKNVTNLFLANLRFVGRVYKFIKFTIPKLLITRLKMMKKSCPTLPRGLVGTRVVTLHNVELTVPEYLGEEGIAYLEQVLAGHQDGPAGYLLDSRQLQKFT